MHPPSPPDVSKQAASNLDHSRRPLPDIGQWGALYPFAAHFMPMDCGQLHYLDERPAEQPDGQQKTLLFVHGNPTWSFHWRGLIGAFGKQYRCVAPDHMGCGYSDLQPRPLRLADHIDHLRQLIGRLDLRQITLVAQDWGGAIGLGAALEDGAETEIQDRFERIILLNTGAFPPWFIPWRIRACRIPWLGQLGVQGLNLFSRAALRMTLQRTARLDRRIEQAYLAPYDRWSRRAAIYQFVEDIPGHSEHPTWQQLAAIESRLTNLSKLPKLLIWGMRDWCFTPECLEKFIGHWPEAQVHRLADVGHWVVEDAPEEVEGLLRQFLDQPAAPPSSSAAVL
jgi:cis-3-alkyl-4-acyloxetan-2-one decarboxylase